jgi:hypothetical protein
MDGGAFQTESGRWSKGLENLKKPSSFSYGSCYIESLQNQIQVHIQREVE